MHIRPDCPGDTDLSFVKQDIPTPPPNWASNESEGVRTPQAPTQKLLLSGAIFASKALFVDSPSSNNGGGPKDALMAAERKTLLMRVRLCLGSLHFAFRSEQDKGCCIEKL